MIKHLKLTISVSEIKDDDRTFANPFNVNKTYSPELERVSNALWKEGLDWWSVIGYKYRSGMISPAHMDSKIPEGTLIDGYEVLVTIDDEITGSLGVKTPEIKPVVKVTTAKSQGKWNTRNL